MVSFFGLGKKKKEATSEDGPVHSLYAQQWKREQSPFGPRVPQNNTSSTSLPARPSSSHSSKSPSGQNSVYANKSATGSMQDLSTSGSKRPGSGKQLPRTGSPLRPTSSDGRPKPSLGNARPMSPGSLAAAASQAGFRFENGPQRPQGAQSPRSSSNSSNSNGNSNGGNNGSQPRTPGDGPANKRPSPGSIERNRSPLGRYEVRSEADSEVSSPVSQAQTSRSNVTSLTSVGSEMDKQIGQWAVRVSASSTIDDKVQSPTGRSTFDLEEEEEEQQQQQQQAEKGSALDHSEENGLKALDTISISEPRQSLMPLSAHDPAAGDGRGYSMILQYYLDSDARESRW